MPNRARKKEGRARPVNILVVDDHPLIFSGLKQDFDGQEHLTLAGEAFTGNQAIKLCREKNFSVVLLDVSLPDMSGVDVARRILKDSPDTRTPEKRPQNAVPGLDDKCPACLVYNRTVGSGGKYAKSMIGNRSGFKSRGRRLPLSTDAGRQPFSV